MGALRGVLASVLVGTAVIQLAMLWTLLGGRDPKDGSSALTAMRVLTALGMVAVQAIAACVWRLLTMVRRDTLFSPAAFRHVVRILRMLLAKAVAAGER